MANMCSMCGGSAGQPRFQKQIDPPAKPYGIMMIGEPPKETKKGSCGGGTQTIQLCLPTARSGMGSGNSSFMTGGRPPPPSQQPMIIQVPSETPIQCPKFVCEPCPPSPPTKIWLIKSSPTPQKSFAIAQPSPTFPYTTQPIVIPCRPNC